MENTTMKCFTRFISMLVILALFLLTLPQRAYAYLDPGTGSYLLQLLIAGLLGASMAVKIFWGNIKAFFSKKSSEGQEIEDVKK
jgi:hypothetical protein